MGATSRLRARIRSLGSATLALVIPIVLLLCGCGPSEPSADIRIINGAEPESLDPAIATGQPDLRVVRSLFEGLTRLDPKTGAAIPALAERWSITNDATTYVFHLRTNAVWSTGQPITADDVVYSWRRALDPATASVYSGQLFYVRNAEEYQTGKTNAEAVGVRAMNPHTLRVDLVAPTPFFLDLCAFPTLAVVPRFHVEKHGDRWIMTQPLPVNGPYLLEHWRIHDRIRLRKNPHHWAVAEMQNEVVDVIPMESPTAAFNLYERGQGDVIWDKNLIPNELLDVLRRRPDCHVFNYLGTYFYRYNVTRKPFEDPRVRMALAMAVNKQRIVDRIIRGGETVASTITPPGFASYTAPEGLRYDPAHARKLLEQAGFKDGRGFPVIQFLFNTSKTISQIAVEYQAMWKEELGLQVELRQSEWKVFLMAQSALDYDICSSSWIGDYADPNTFLDLFMSNNGNNRTGWKNPRYDALIREGNREVDPRKRAKLLAEAESILIRDEVPVVPIYFYAGINFFDTNRIEGIYSNLIDEHPLYAIRKKK